MGIRQVASEAKLQMIMRRRQRHEIKTYRDFKEQRFSTTDELIDAHFRTWSIADHVNRPGFEVALSRMAGRPLNILETGTSAWGIDSTRLWDSYVNNFGGQFWSVDLSPTPKTRLLGQVGSSTQLVVDDSVHFLATFASIHSPVVVDVCYLDSWDLDWSDPDPAAAHGLAEWQAVAPLMQTSAILIIDDSPASLKWVPTEHHEAAQDYLASHGYLPGKGALAHQELIANPKVRVLWHGYNAVYEFLH